MSENCHRKVCYIGGWVISKLVSAHRKYVNCNVALSNASVRSEMHNRYVLVQLVESIMISSSARHSTSIFRESLEITDLKQYRENSLLYINSDTFKFFMHLEQSRIDLLCKSRLNSLKSDMFTIAITKVKESVALMEQWVNLFEDKSDRTLLIRLFHQVVDTYFHMGYGQYLRDVQRDHNIQKTEAHHKRVVEKKNVQERKDNKVTIKQISTDTAQTRKILIGYL